MSNFKGIGKNQQFSKKNRIKRKNVSKVYCEMCELLWLSDRV